MCFYQSLCAQIFHQNKAQFDVKLNIVSCLCFPVTNAPIVTTLQLQAVLD